MGAMGRGILGLTVCVLVAAVLLFERSQPPADLMERQSPNPFKQQRQAWLDLIHGTAPGVDWRELERQNRARKFDRRNQERKAYFAKSKRIDPVVEAFPDLGLKGRWRELGSNDQAGRVVATRYIPESGDLLAIADGGQVWRRDGVAGQWQVLNDSLQLNGGVGVFQTNQGSSQRLAVVQGFPVRAWFSDDDGLTWTEAQTPAEFVGATQDSWLADNGDIVVFASARDEAGSDHRFLRSVDGGASYQLMGTTRVAAPAHVDPWYDKVTDTAYTVVVEDSQLRLVTFANDGGVSSQPIPGITSGSSNRHHQLSGNGDTLYLAVRDPDSGDSDRYQIYRSEDAGASWLERGEITSNVFFMGRSFAVSPFDSNYLVIGGIDAFYSSDGGISWQQVNNWFEYYGQPATKLHADLPYFEFAQTNDGRELLFVSTDGGVFESDDRLASVNNLSLKGLNNAQYYDTYTDPANSHRFVAGSQDQGLQIGRVYDTSPTGFSQQISGDYAYLASGPTRDDLWSVYPGTVYYISDVGIAPGGNVAGLFGVWDTNSRLFLPPLMADPVVDGVAWAGSEVDQLATLNRLEFDSSNGLVAQPVAADFSDGNTDTFISALGYSALDPSYRYIVSAGRGGAKFFLSQDNGQTWQRQAGFTPLDGGFLVGQAILADPAVLGRVYVGGSGYSNPAVFRSDNHGDTFVPMSEGLPPTMVYQLASSPSGQLFAATEAGPYAYSEAAQRWIDISGIAAPSQTYTSVEYIDRLNVVRFGTYGRGVWDLELVEEAAEFAGLEPGHSGVYFDPANDGQGIFLEILNDTQANLAWFTYDANGQQVWLVGVGEIDGRSIVFRDALITQGASFGTAFDPNDVVRDSWGQLALTFDGCDVVDFSYNGPFAFGSSTQNMVRISGLHGLPCGQPAAADAITDWGGAYFDADRSGEGIFVQPIANDRALVTWYTYDLNGRQAWLIGDGSISGDQIDFSTVQQPLGGRFGPFFDPTTVDRRDWGQIQLQRSSCNQITLSFQGPSAYGQGSYSLQRLTKPAGLNCPPS